MVWQSYIIQHRRHIVYAIAVLAIALAGFVASFQHFVLTLPTLTAGPIQTTDGIVVTTGGQQRLSSGIRLLADNKAQKLLISGVGQGVNRAILVQELALNDDEINALFCCVELEYGAIDTRGNAAAAREWVITHDMRSLRLVTANYHMPRALIMFRRALPEVEIYPWPVTPPDLTSRTWWRDPPIMRLLLREYAKYMVTRIGL